MSGRTLEPENFPPLFHAAETTSRTAQAHFFLATQIRLLALVAAAISGAFTLRVGAGFDLFGVGAALAFLFAVIVESYLLRFKPERLWYQARAAAESAKTLTWRYAVGGHPFDIGIRPNSETDKLFSEQVDSILEVLRSFQVEAPPRTQAQIAPGLRLKRSGSLDERKELYEYGRVANQQKWYLDNAQVNAASAKRWTIGMLTVEVAGGVAAMAKAIGITPVDLLGIAAALVAGIGAWSQAKQHRTLASAYAVTALELPTLRTAIGHQKNELEWATFVSDAEEAFSREHTLWRASRGILSLDV